ncbi:MAG TPA: bacillithiol biosynthesis BshC [Gemmatimonadaceae bacterium]|nr:bacillithiol biosynthesis BshC [Gemmatimonadaceae bacterium]
MTDADGRSPARRDAGAVVVRTEPLGGSALSRVIQDRAAPAQWAIAAPDSPDAWRARIDATRAAFEGSDWLAAIGDAVSATGPGRDRLERVARAGGMVVTTGQQPGLFGGPIYTWSKALSALALADTIERELGIPAAPLFWAATDDADLLEAQGVWVATASGAVALRGNATALAGTPAARVPQGDLSAQLAVLRDAAGSAADAGILDAVDAAYGDPTRTIGDAYLRMLEATLDPLGIPLLDAAHPAVRRAGRSVTRAALRHHARVADALARRDREIRALELEPQVEEVAGLTPVFLYEPTGTRRRLTSDEAAAVADDVAADLGANVLLRPIMEAAIVPTVAYVAGPGELAYFAQVTALAEAVDARVPVAVPRWSGTLIEPRAQRIADRLGLSGAELSDLHGVESRLARGAMPAPLRDAIADLESTLGSAVERVAAADTSALIPRGVIDGLGRRIAHQLARFERRAQAAVKRRESALMREIAFVSGFFFPGGSRQERALSLIPTLARYGLDTLEAMRHEAERHAGGLLGTRARRDVPAPLP